MMTLPSISRRSFKPRLASTIEKLRKKHPRTKLFFHSRSDIMAIVPKVAESAFDILDPVQLRCTDPAATKRAHGDKLTLPATTSSQRTLPLGTPNHVHREAEHRIVTCGHTGGLIHTHNDVVQYDVPTANPLALYDGIRQTKYRGGA